MPDGIRWVGLDVHIAHESTIAIFDQGTGELTTRRVVGRPHELMPWLRGCPGRRGWSMRPVRPGYGPARRARAEGIELVVCSPGRADVPRLIGPGTDKRDAIRLCQAVGGGRVDDRDGPIDRARAVTGPAALPRGHPDRSDARPASARKFLGAARSTTKDLRRRGRSGYRTWLAGLVVRRPAVPADDR